VLDLARFRRRWHVAGKDHRNTIRHRETPGCAPLGLSLFGRTKGGRREGREGGGGLTFAVGWFHETALAAELEVGLLAQEAFAGLKCLG